MKPFYASPNFWLAIVIVIGGFFVGFPAGAAGDAVAAIFGLVGAGGIMYRFFKEKPAIQVKPWIQDANFWNYSTVLAVSALPVIGPQIMPALEDVTTKLFRGDWGGAIMSFVSLATIVVKILQSKK
jgi:hypothetical protein